MSEVGVSQDYTKGWDLSYRTSNMQLVKSVNEQFK